MQLYSKRGALSNNTFVALVSKSKLLRINQAVSNIQDVPLFGIVTTYVSSSLPSKSKTRSTFLAKYSETVTGRCDKSFVIGIKPFRSTYKETPCEGSKCDFSLNVYF